MPTTTNYGWTTPADTDLVKDGAAAIRTLGSGADTTVKNLNPETTLGDMHYASATANTNTRLAIGTSGQVLTVNGGVPAWVTPVGDIEGVTAGTGISGGGTSGTVTITNSMATTIDAKGDLIVGTADNAFARLAVGATNGHVLQIDSSTATGLKWASAPAGTPTFVGVSCYKSASAQSLSNDTSAAITFDAEEFDTDAYHSTASNTSRITIPSGKAGKYLFVATIEFDSNSSGNRAIFFNKNGSLVTRGQRFAPSGSSVSNYTTSCILDLAVADYIEVFAYQNSGGSLNVNNAQTSTRFAAYYLGA